MKLVIYKFSLSISLVMAMLLLVPSAQTADVLIADFEGSDYGMWSIEGNAFGEAPAKGTLPNQMNVSGFNGNRLVNSYYGGDDSKGKLTSLPFKITRRYINFLIGGGKKPGEACINLIYDGDVVRTATGPNDRPGGSERLEWHSWEVPEFWGKFAVIQIIDQAAGGWGHINVDHIVLSHQKRQAEPAERKFHIEKTYLHLPVKNGAPKRRMKFLVDGQVEREFRIELAEEKPDFWVFSHVAVFDDKRLTVVVDALPGESKGLSLIRQSNEVPGAANLYEEKYRPQFHFTTRRGWNNDPNGLVFYDGEYHLYYQHNPYGWSWGNMHWGHAVSTDLVHWRELPVALYPYEYGDWCFSGSAVVDEENTAGFKTGMEDVIIAAYTSTGRGESIAYSNDRGRTFTDYEGNPVVEHRGRDPKVIWYEPGEHWVMAVYDEVGNSRGIAFYTSNDLKEWTRQSRIDGYYECPELFELPIEESPDQTKWVVYGADGAYSIATFDGKAFHAESGKHKFNYGNCFYASQTYNNIPEDDGRRIQIAWGRTGHQSMPFNQQMNFPVTLALHQTNEGLRLFAKPVNEIEKLYGKKLNWKDFSVYPEREDTFSLGKGECVDLDIVFHVDKADLFGVDVRGVPVVYDAKKQLLVCNDKSASLKPDDDKIKLRILVDRLSLEIFANDGKVYMPMSAFFEEDQRSLNLFSVGKPTYVERVDVRHVKSIWKD